MTDLFELTLKLSLDLHEVEEKIGDQALRLTTLRDLNSTIDRMFEELEKLGKPELLEKLCPYFGVVWPSARALAFEVLKEFPNSRQRSVLEMGCGLAIPSLIAARRGFDAVATDFHPQVRRLLEINRERNQASNLVYREWDWQGGAPVRDSLPRKFDWVIGSDLLYDRELPVPLARTMTEALAPHGRITLTDPARPYLQAFCDEITKNLGFQQASRVVSVPHPQPGNPDFKQEIFVLEFKRR